jgi:hypothetical protein
VNPSIVAASEELRCGCLDGIRELALARKIGEWSTVSDKNGFS